MVEERSEVYLSLGSNLGDRVQALKQAVELIAARLGKIEALSEVYQTQALLKPDASKADAKNYLNCALRVSSKLGPSELLSEIHKIENELGRDRQTESRRWAARTIDIDILLIGQQQLETEKLSLPHPEILNRAFILKTLLELKLDLKCPASGVSYASKLKELSVEGMTLTTYKEDIKPAA